MSDQAPNLNESDSQPKRPFNGDQLEDVHPAQRILPGDSTITKLEKIEGNGAIEGSLETGEPSAKRVKREEPEGQSSGDTRTKIHGVAMVKPE